ncbi:MAG: discoidin domain-containing protein [Chlorobiaceae bacterium]|jgi:hypothetical protein|nr:discoidin domain-containing protein [Chlorobiaceae bacterium]NTV16255.1 discoidin domain-containing protein [Chlorobiaceae bacterium]
MRRIAFGKFMFRISLFCFAIMASSQLQAAPINPVEVFGDGEYSNDAQLLIDGYMPEQGSAFDGPECVYWSDPRVSFEIDLGGVYNVDGIAMQADNNDNYIIEASRDGRYFSRMLFLNSQIGEIGWGMETVSTERGSRHYLPGLRFIPSRARYLRVSAHGGDRLYAVSEVRVFASRPFRPYR